MTRFSRTDLQSWVTGESRINRRIRGKSEEQLERDIAQDADWSDIPHDRVERQRRSFLRARSSFRFGSITT